MRWSLILLLALSCAPPVEEDPNESPAATLTFPERWPLGEPVPFDASGSADFDGVLSDVRLGFGDGSEEQSRLDGVFAHAYPAAGTYEVRLVVVDEDDATDEVSGVVVVTDNDDASCDCALGCQDERSVCTGDTGCWLSALSDRAIDREVDPASPPPAISCP